MRYLRIFLLHFEQALEYRSISVVWFLVELFNPLLYLLFWRGVAANPAGTSGIGTISEIYSYYLLLIVAGAFLTVHIEEDVALRDIKEGGLVKYLIRPFSYFWFNFFGELPYRIIQGFFAVVILVVATRVFGVTISPYHDVFQFAFVPVIFILGYLLSFVFKMIVGFIAFWVIDYSGIQQTVTVIFLAFGGFIMPIHFFPTLLRHIAEWLPFSYMIYFPVLALQGKLMPVQALGVVAMQGVWLIGLIFLYRLMWNKGIKKFTGVGQ